MPLEDDRPESFLGLMMAFEGVSDGYAIIHGPTGCKYYPASVSESDYPFRGSEPSTRNLFRFGGRYFFGQPRLPCTYLDMGRFVTGAGDRLRDLYSKVEAMEPSLICVVNSPGASLTGENLSALHGGVPTVIVDHAQYSGTAAEGFQDAVLEITKVVEPNKTEKRSGVNLVGISILHLNWEDTIGDLTRLLNACGIEVNCTIGAGWSVEDIRRSASAELNILVYPEWGDRIAEDYENRFGIPSAESPEGAPIGFDSIECWIRTVCGKLGRDPTPSIGIVAEYRRRAASAMKIMESHHLLPKGRTFSCFADGSTAYAVSRFLYSYLGMIPVTASAPNGKEWLDKMLKFFDSKGIPIGDNPENTDTDVILSSGGIGVSLVSRGIAQGSIDIEGPGIKFIRVNPEPPVGLEGTMRLLDGVLNIIANKQRFR